LSILIYHRVLPATDPLTKAPDAATFRWQLQLLKTYFNVLPLGEAVHRLARGALPPRSVCITFDDGYLDNFTHALPLLREFDLPATFFISVGFLDGGIMWNDIVIEAIRQAKNEELDLTSIGAGAVRLRTPAERRNAIRKILASLKYVEAPKRMDFARAVAEMAGAKEMPGLMMNRAHVKALSEAGMEIGGHTVTHPILTAVPAEVAEREIHEGREALEAILAEEVDLFAYPNGQPGLDYRAEHVAMVRRAGFKAAVSTAWGVATRHSDPLQLPRFTPWDTSPGRFFLRLLGNGRRVGPVSAEG
jgi:peptidoglycan/xylan/chitin deacetylase (PgdA/CDA1 family)